MTTMIPSYWKQCAEKKCVYFKKKPPLGRDSSRKQKLTIFGWLRDLVIMTNQKKKQKLMAVQKHIIVILQSRTCGYYKKYD